MPLPTRTHPDLSKEMCEFSTMLFGLRPPCRTLFCLLRTGSNCWCERAREYTRTRILLALTSPGIATCKTWIEANLIVLAKGLQR